MMDAPVARFGFLHVRLLDTTDCKNACLCKKASAGLVINTLLAEENLCATLDDLVSDGLNHPSLLRRGMPWSWSGLVILISASTQSF